MRVNKKRTSHFDLLLNSKFLPSSKRSQALAITAILLIIFTLVLLAIVITVFITKPNFVSTIGFPNAITSKIVDERNYQQDNKPSELICNYPYIKVGNECCLDKNYNGICDNDELEKETITTISSCSYPYIKIGTTCCLDDNDNGICDNDDTGRKRIRSSDMDSPFDIHSIDIERDELSFDLENEGSEGFIIKKIKIDDCDSEYPDKTIEKGDERNFDFECDFDSRVDSDIDVDYMKIGGNETLTASGNLRVDFNYRN